MLLTPTRVVAVKGIRKVNSDGCEFADEAFVAGQYLICSNME